MEIFKGTGKYRQLQAVVISIPIGILCLQETKPSDTDLFNFPKVHLYLSGQPTDPMRGSALPSLLSFLSSTSVEWSIGCSHS